MRRALLLVPLALLAFTGRAGAQEAEPVCPAWDGDGPWVGHFDGGGETEITFTAPDGWVVTDICVKAGSANQGDGPEFIHYDPPQQSVTFSHTSGKQISHWSAIKVQGTVTTTSTTVPETTTTTVPETTTTTVPETTTTTAPDDTTTTTAPDESTTTTAPTTTTTQPECEDNPDTPERECTPRTGAETGLLALLGAACVAVGAGAIKLARRGA